MTGSFGSAVLCTGGFLFLFYSIHRSIVTTLTLDTMLCLTPKIRGDLSKIIPFGNTF